ncbi:staphylopine family metallophore export MFS transporter CntE [Cohnella hongkongensis]|uniref:Staphylopine family metallophore export MFS transporter CntE n=1 Tax=Cohnella hongkongensis TaxID=178337 RepID=A0ABV9FLK3_9BACL
MNGVLSGHFFRLYSLTFLYFSANAILNVVIPLRGESLGATNTTIGIVMGAYLFTTMLFRPWAGQIIRKHGPLRVLRYILAINGTALLLYTFTGLGGYFLARMLQGICTAFFSMALQLGIIDSLPDKDRSRGISMYSLWASLPGIIGPLLAVGMWQTGEMSLFSAVMIAIAILTGVVGFNARMENGKAESDSSQTAHEATTHQATMLQSIVQLIKNQDLLKCSVLMATASIVFGAVTTFIPLYASRIEGGNAAVYLMLQASTVVLVRFAWSKKIPSDGKWHPNFVAGIMMILVFASVLISVSVTGGAGFLYIGAILMGIAYALLYPMLTTYLSFVLPQANRNVLLGLFIGMADLGISMSGVVMGPIADHFSYSVMYMICGLLGVLMILVALKRAKRTLGA